MLNITNKRVSAPHSKKNHHQIPFYELIRISLKLYLPSCHNFRLIATALRDLANAVAGGCLGSLRSNPATHSQHCTLLPDFAPDNQIMTVINVAFHLVLRLAVPRFVIVLRALALDD